MLSQLSITINSHTCPSHPSVALAVEQVGAPFPLDYLILVAKTTHSALEEAQRKILLLAGLKVAETV